MLFELHVADSCDDGLDFSPYFSAFFGLLFGVEALLIHDYGAVDIHTLLDSSEQQQQQQQQQPGVCARVCPFLRVTFCPWTLASSPVQVLHSAESSDDCGCGGVTSSSRSLRPWPRLPTTQPYGDRRRPGPGRRGTGTSTRRHGDRSPLLPSRSSSSCSKRKSLAVPGHPVWVSRGGRRRRSSSAPSSSSPTSYLWCRFWTLLSCLGGIRWWRCCGCSTCRLSSRSSQCPRSLWTGSPSVLPFAVRRRQNSWWMCRQMLYAFTGYQQVYNQRTSSPWHFACCCIAWKDSTVRTGESYMTFGAQGFLVVGLVSTSSCHVILTASHCGAWVWQIQEEVFDGVTFFSPRCSAGRKSAGLPVFSFEDNRCWEIVSCGPKGLLHNIM